MIYTLEGTLNGSPEYPNSPAYKGNCTMRYLLPVDAFEKLPVTK